MKVSGVDSNLLFRFSTKIAVTSYATVIFHGSRVNLNAVLICDTVLFLFVEGEVITIRVEAVDERKL